ncbi:hypothetical protein N0X72_14785 [Streptomyces carpaticus]|uniref:hypothetical protein n=1 Tax=Streptomyces carpaticus TaxID=285558 RepID=UPI0021FB2DA3|nr:hypothetical protein N0X72_14785 [Streptomyces carpaticus]
MGKRERRRRREAAAGKAAASGYGAALEPGEEGGATYLTPGEEAPVLRVVVDADAPDEVRKRALRYWSLNEDGTWTNRVAELGQASWVTEAVSTHAYAHVFTLACPDCGALPRVRTRSELGVIRNLRPSSAFCEECASKPRPVIPPPAQSPEQGHPQQQEGDDAKETSQEEPAPRLEVDILEDAPEELVAIAQQYWSLAYLEPEGQYAVWTGRVKAIDTTGWGPAHIAAGAAVRARMPGRSCPTCAGPLTLTSRTAFEQACFGSTPDCVDCTPALLEKMNKLRDPSRSAGAPPRQRASPRAERNSAEARWVEQQSEAIRSLYKVGFFPDAPLPTAGIRTEATALALLHYAPSTTPIGPVCLWADPLDPDPLRTIGDLLASGFLVIHPDSPPEAFCWDPENFREAISAASGDIDAVQPPQLTTRYYAREAVHYVPYGTSMGTAAENVTAHLTERLAPDALDQGRKEELLVLLEELIAAEALRYFDLQLAKRHLPPVPDNHLVRLKDVAQRGSSMLTLGEMNNLVWRAARSAADAAQRNPQAPRANMSTFAVNCLETYVQQALADPQAIKPYTFDASLLAALTRTVFYTVLNADPFTTGVIQAQQILPEGEPPAESHEAEDRHQTPEQPGAGVDTVGEPGEHLKMDKAIIAWLAGHRSEWTAKDFTDHLLYLQSQALAPRPTSRHHAQAAAAGRVSDLYHHLAELLGGNDQDAVLAACASAQHSTCSTTRNTEGSAKRLSRNSSCVSSRSKPPTVLRLVSDGCEFHIRAYQEPRPGIAEVRARTEVPRDPRPVRAGLPGCRGGGAFDGAEVW